MRELATKADAVFEKLSHAIRSLSKSVDENLESIIDKFYKCNGRVVFTGIGKSGLVAKKAAATFSSTGSASFFLHPTEALHGDLGVLHKNDLVVVISKSGESEELSLCLRSLKNLQIESLLICFNPKASLIQLASDCLILPDVGEICLFNIAPTTSTLQTMAMLDFIAIELMERRKFTPRDFAAFHPAGRIGKRLLYNVKDLMVNLSSLARLDIDDTIKTCMLSMSSKGFGVAFVYDKSEFKGIVTDGDIRRFLTSSTHAISLEDKISNLVINSPVAIDAESLAYDVLCFFEAQSRSLAFIVVLDKDMPVGIIRPYDLIGLK